MNNQIAIYKGEKYFCGINTLEKYVNVYYIIKGRETEVKRIQFNDLNLSELYIRDLKASFKNMECCFGKGVMKYVDDRVEYTKDGYSMQFFNHDFNSLLIELGFTYDRVYDSYFRETRLEECDEIYEVRTDYIVPKGVDIEKDKIISDGYIVQKIEYNDGNISIMSKKVLFKNGIRVAQGECL